MGNSLYTAHFTDGPTSGPAFEAAVDLLYESIVATANRQKVLACYLFLSPISTHQNVWCTSRASNSLLACGLVECDT